MNKQSIAVKDWNDLHCSAGLAEVRRQLLAVIEPGLVAFKQGLSRALSTSVVPVESSATTEIKGSGEVAVNTPVFTLDIVKRRFVFMLGDTKVFDEYSRLILKKSAFENLVTKKLAQAWYDSPDKRVQHSEVITRFVEDVRLRNKADKGELPPIKRYILIDGTKDVWDHQLRKRVSVGAVNERLADGFKIWRNSPERKVIKPENIIFDPTLPDMGADFINTFEGLPLVAIDDVSKCQSIKEMLRFLCNYDDKATHWVTCWLAYPLQHKGAKMGTALLFHSTKEGSGKSFLYSEIMGKIYGKYGVTVGQAELESKYTAWRSNVLYGVFEEVVSKDQRYNQVGNIKHMITGKNFRFDDKFISGWQERNFMNLVFLSNESIPWPISENDRRMMVIWPEQPLPQEFADKVAREIANQGVEAFYYYLLNYDLGDFSENTKPLHTAARGSLVEASKRSTHVFLDRWRNGLLGVPFSVCIASDIYYIYQEWCKDTGRHATNDTQFAVDMKKEMANSGNTTLFWYESTARRKRRQAIVYLPNAPSDFKPGDAKRLGEFVKLFRDAAYEAGYSCEKWKKDGSWSVPSDFS